MGAEGLPGWVEALTHLPGMALFTTTGSRVQPRLGPLIYPSDESTSYGPGLYTWVTGQLATQGPGGARGPDPVDPDHPDAAGGTTPDLSHVGMPGAGVIDPADPWLGDEFQGTSTETGTGTGSSEAWECPWQLVAAASGTLYYWCPYETNPQTGEPIQQLQPVPEQPDS